jgi:hypothetical protein
MWEHDPEHVVQFMKAAYTSGDADLVLDFLDERTAFVQERGLLGSMPVTMLLQPRLWIRARHQNLVRANRHTDFRHAVATESAPGQEDRCGPPTS